MKHGLRLALAATTAALVAAACSLGFGDDYIGEPDPGDASTNDAPADTSATPGTDAADDSAADANGDTGTVAPADSVTRGLVAHYRFDEPSGNVVKDSSGLALDGLFKNGDAGPPTRVPGRRGNALAFAAGAIVDVPHHPSRNTSTPFTLSFWVNAPANAGFQPRLITDGDAFDVKLNERTMQLEIAGCYAAVNYELPDDRWTHFALVFDGHGQWYVDGFAVPNANDTLDGGQAPLTTSAPLRFANSYDLGDPYTGMLDDIRLYSVALTAAEIKLLAMP